MSQFLSLFDISHESVRIYFQDKEGDKVSREEGKEAYSDKYSNQAKESIIIVDPHDLLNPN